MLHPNKIRKSSCFVLLDSSEEPFSSLQDMTTTSKAGEKLSRLSFSEKTGGIIKVSPVPKEVWKFFISINNNLRWRLRIFSETKIKKVILRKLFLQFLWGELLPIELEVLILLALEDNDDLILEAINATKTIQHKLLRARVNALCSLLGRKPFSLREYLSSKGFFLKIVKDKVKNPSSRNIIKYSGWRRHQNDQGALRPFNEDPFPLIPENIVRKVNFFSALTVGVIHNNSGEGSLIMAFNKAETVRYLRLIEENFNESFKLS